MYETLIRSISISISRSIPVLSPILLVFLLTEFRPDWITSFSLCFSMFSVFCVIPALLGITIQTDDVDSFNHNKFLSLFIILMIYFISIYLFFYFIGSSTFKINDPAISKEAYDLFMLMIISIPFLGISCILGMFLEKINKENIVLKLRFLQLIIEISLITFVVYYATDVKYIAYIYIFSDFIILIPLFFYVIKIKSSLINFNISNSFFEVLVSLKVLIPILVGAVFFKYLNFINLSTAAKISVESSNVFSVLNSLVAFLTIPLIGLHAIIIIEGSKIKERGFVFVASISNLLKIYTYICFSVISISVAILISLSFFNIEIDIVKYIVNYKTSFFLLIVSSFLTIVCTAISIALKNLYVYQFIFISSMCYVFLFASGKYIIFKSIDELVLIYFIVVLFSCFITFFYHLNQKNILNIMAYIYRKFIQNINKTK